jgi:hypothetical protein
VSDALWTAIVVFFGANLAAFFAGRTVELWEAGKRPRAAGMAVITLLMILALQHAFH